MADINVPSWFNAEEYLNNKLEQLKATEPKADWTEEKLTKVLEENGYKGDEGAYKHFTDFGMNENVSPNAMFDVKEYLAAKAKQLTDMNVDGKVWTEVSVMDAIKAAGMNSAWEHYDKFGSAEGINPSNEFNAEGYILAKTQLMNETSEGGRSNWTVAEVKAAFAENGFSALEHYNLFGQAEFKAAGKEADLAKAIEVTNKVDVNNTFDPYTGAETYATLVAALAAQKEGSLAAKYAITAAADAGDVTVAQQAGLADLLAGATPAVTTTPTYHLVDTVAALAGVSTTILTGSNGGYDISDSLASVAAGADGLVNQAENAFAKVAFGAKAADPNVEGSKADVVTTTVKYDDIDDKSGITLVKADDKAEGDAVVSVDASAEKAGITLNLGTLFDKVDDKITDGLTFNAIGSDKDDIITAHEKGGVITGGKGADTINLGTGADILHYAAGDSTSSAYDTISANLGSGDKIEYTTTMSIAANTGAVKGVGVAEISATGLASFDGGDTTISAMITAVAGGMDAVKGYNVAGKAAVFTDGSDSYIFISDGVAGLGDNDVVIKVTGVTADGLTITGGDITAITTA